MKAVIRLMIFALAVIGFSCEDTRWYINCSDCTSSEPESVNLVIRISTGDLPVTLSIFEGELEDNVLYFSTVTRDREFKYLVSLNKRYTVTATYIIGNNTYYAVDSTIPRVRYVEDQCEDPCYYLYDRIIDLQLKYTVD